MSHNRTAILFFADEQAAKQLDLLAFALTAIYSGILIVCVVFPVLCTPFTRHNPGLA